MNKLSEYLKDITEFIYPSLCVTCQKRLISQEKFLCIACWSDLPLTRFHLQPGNPVEKLFWGRVKIENATAYFSYKKGSKYRRLIHDIKYRGMKELGYEAGRKFGFMLSESKWINQIDVIVPVPLHRKKEKKRGYNQSEWIARGISEVLHIPLIVKNLKRVKHSATQTRKSRFERWKNVENIFEVVNPEIFNEKHVLLIDDVVTTGSTIEACTIALKKRCNAKVSVATLGFADM
ncbi:MAG: amidophosphoribosyltransferase [Draconibacterium sp.]|nr:MAG: amidophosphoribosyltransferase [Draconibacterium sp.]